MIRFVAKWANFARICGISISASGTAVRCRRIDWEKTKFVIGRHAGELAGMIPSKSVDFATFVRNGAKCSKTVFFTAFFARIRGISISANDMAVMCRWRN